jgi:ABC-type bacteriocin/lantibiotic exporter with double-glycine peptidase domain
MRIHGIVATSLLLALIILPLFESRPGRRRMWGTLLSRQGAVFQVRDSDCGLAALTAVARLSGSRPVSYRRFLDRHPPGPEGFSLAELEVIGRELGLDLTPWRLTVAHLKLLSNPAVLHLEGDHYVALVGREREGWLVMDPALGILHIGRRELQSVFSGAALIHTSDQAALAGPAATIPSVSARAGSRER